MLAYQTVLQKSKVEINIQKSRFIAECMPVADVETATKELAAIKKQSWDAAHHCYAYVIDPDGNTMRYSDDGEPSGTAGQPILEAIRYKSITNALCVVTRYFGGVLLGAGGLVRAYTRAAGEAVRLAKPVWMRPCGIYFMKVEYACWGGLVPLLQGFGAVEDICYEDTVTLSVKVPLENRDHFEKAVIEHTGGGIKPRMRQTRYGMFEQ
ncbi:MAG: YigZ family protein [Clostridiales bacterium]|jgi:uncharacterized YigZ family protein|nr:YigZ family protein [Clostridiales bacterium]